MKKPNRLNEQMKLLVTYKSDKMNARCKILLEGTKTGYSALADIRVKGEKPIAVVSTGKTVSSTFDNLKDAAALAMAHEKVNKIILKSCKPTTSSRRKRK